MEGKKNGRLFCNHRYRIFQKEGFRWNLYPILPISDFKTVDENSSHAHNLMLRMALGGWVGSRAGDPGAAVHGTQETSAGHPGACDGFECSQRAGACWTPVRGCGVVDVAYRLSGGR